MQTYTRGDDLGDLEFGDDVLDTIPKAWPTEENDKVGLHQTKNIFSVKNT